MPPPNYDYRGLVASTWDLWRDDTANWSDRHFYLDIIKQFGQPVLDLGCGTGRLLVDFLQQGIDIDGIDNSPEMLAICHEKATRLDFSPVLDVRPLERLRSLPRRYRTILAASSALQLIPAADARRAVRCCLDHLQPGGAMTGSFAFEWRPGEPLDTGWTLLFEKPRPTDGVIVRSWTREWREPEKRCWHTEQRFEVVSADAGRTVLASEFHRRSPEGWWYTQEQAKALFESADVRHISVQRGFDHTPAEPDDRLFTVLAVKL